MAHEPAVALVVSDVTRSIAFYVAQIGFELVEHRPDADVALVRDSDGDLLLMAGPHAGDLGKYLSQKSRVLGSGDTLSFASVDLDVLHPELMRRGLTVPEIAVMRWGDRVLHVQDPDGYKLNFWAPAQRTSEEMIALYVAGIDELEAALAGLSEQDLDMARDGSDWTIRQIVHHIADADMLFALSMTMALAEPGRRFTQNWPSDNAPYARNLQYAQRDIAPSLALVRAIRTHFAVLARQLPDALERAVVDADGSTWSFGRFLNIDLRHAFEHVDEIRVIRAAQGR